MLIVDQERKQSNFRIGPICGPEANTRGKYLISFVTVQEWLSLLTLLTTGLPRQFCCSERLLE